MFLTLICSLEFELANVTLKRAVFGMSILNVRDDAASNAGAVRFTNSAEVPYVFNVKHKAVKVGVTHGWNIPTRKLGFSLRPNVTMIVFSFEEVWIVCFFPCLRVKE